MIRTIRVWTPEETATARALVKANASNDACMEALNRSRSACRAHVRYVDDPEVRHKMKSRYRPRKSEAVAGNHMAEGSRGAPPPRLMEEANQRACAPRTLTAWVFGDPAPGMSALDRRGSAL